MRVFHCDHHDIPLPPGHRFPAEKYRLLKEGLLSRGVLHPAELQPSPLATREQLVRAHTEAYVDAVLRGELDERAQRRLGLPWSPQLVTRSLASVGGTLAAARAALEDGLGGSLGGGTHHAMRDHGEGFCVFNDVAVALLALRAEGRLRRAAVVDLDVHQGNGNAEILGADPEVHILCLHGEKNFPFRKVLASQAIGLPDQMADQAYLDTLSAALPAVFASRPELLFYLAGVDPLADDSLGRLALSLDGLRRRDRLVLQACHHHQVPLVLVMAGGYARPITLSVEAHLGTYLEAREIYR